MLNKLRGNGMSQSGQASGNTICRRSVGKLALLGSAAGLSAVMYGSAAFAAEAEAPAAQVAEVVVTARHRAEDLEKTPSSIGTVQAEQIQAMGVQSVVDLDSRVPSLNFASTATRPYPFTGIRGVGDYSRNPGYANRAGIYLDGVLMGRSSTVDYPVFDIQQVEVLRGPQGTLFGKDSLSGVVSITTAKPTLDDGWKANVAAGSRNYLSATGYVNTQVADNLAMRVSLVGQRQDGYYTNQYDGSHPGGYLNFAARVQLRWTPSADTTVDLSIDGASSRQDLLLGGTPLAAPATLPAALSRAYLTLGNYTVNWGLAPYANRQIYGTSLTVEQKLPKDFTFVSISSYRSSAEDAMGGLSLAPYDYGRSFDHPKDYSISQEFRLVSPVNKYYDYVLGAFYYNDQPRTSTTLVRGPDFQPQSLVGATLNRHSVVHEDVFALFGHFTLRPTEWLTIDGGLRFNDDRKHVNYGQNPGALAAQGFANVPSYVDTLHDTSVNPLLSVSVTPFENVHLYALYSTGQRVGGFNVDLVTVNTLALGNGSLRFNSESVKNYEVGAKTVLFDRRLRLNVAAYRENFDDFQVAQFSLVPLANGSVVSASTITNAARAIAEGVEADFDAAVFTGFHLSGGFGFNHAYFDSFPHASVISAGPPIVFGDFTGHTLIEAPRFQASLTPIYNWQLTEKIDASASLSYVYKGHTYSDPSNVAASLQGAYADVSARLAFANHSGAEVAFFARNLFDEIHVEGASLSGAAVPFHTFNAPRMFGVELTLRH
jgi:iron complex outermembrane receptor protein